MLIRYAENKTSSHEIMLSCKYCGQYIRQNKHKDLDLSDKLAGSTISNAHEKQCSENPRNKGHIIRKNNKKSKIYAYSYGDNWFDVTFKDGEVKGFDFPPCPLAELDLLIQAVDKDLELDQGIRKLDSMDSTNS